jgi:hypothetical protein
MIPHPRPSLEALPPWLARLPEIQSTPVRPGRPPDEGLLRRTLANRRLPLHVAILAMVLGVAAAVAAGAVRARHTAESHAEMSSLAARKAAELRAFGMLRPVRPKGDDASPLAIGGSLTDDVVGYSDVVEGTDGRRFRRRWAIERDAAGARRIVIRMIPMTRAAGDASFDLVTVMAHP